MKNTCNVLCVDFVNFRLYEMGKFQEPQKETEAYSAGQVPNYAVHI